MWPWPFHQNSFNKFLAMTPTKFNPFVLDHKTIFRVLSSTFHINIFLIVILHILPSIINLYTYGLHINFPRKKGEGIRRGKKSIVPLGQNPCVWYAPLPRSPVHQQKTKDIKTAATIRPAIYTRSITPGQVHEQTYSTCNKTSTTTQSQVFQTGKYC